MDVREPTRRRKRADAVRERFFLDADACPLRQVVTTLGAQMLTDPISLERALTAGFLASLAIIVAFGPELRRALIRLRSRRVPDAPSDPALGVEAQQL